MELTHTFTNVRKLFKLSTALEVPYETLQKLYSMQMLYEPTVFNVLIKDDYKRITRFYV